MADQCLSTGHAIVAGGAFPVVMFVIAGIHWRLSVPLFGFGLATPLYLRQAVRSFGGSAALGLAGMAVILSVAAVAGR